MKRALLGLALLLCAGLSAQSGDDPIPSPDRWVPFEADVYQTQVDAPDLVGRVFRDSNGSIRTEMKTWDETMMNVTVIINNQTHKMWRKVVSVFGQGEQDFWIEEHISPRLMPKLTRQTGGLTDRERRIEGFEVIEIPSVETSGAYTLLAPALNFYELDQVSPNLRRTLSNIQVREPDPNLFLPPPHERVVDRQRK